MKLTVTIYNNCTCTVIQFTSKPYNNILNCTILCRYHLLLINLCYICSELDCKLYADFSDGKLQQSLP